MTDDRHNHPITRQAQVFLPSAELQVKWPELSTVGVIYRTRYRGKRAIDETIYYLSRRLWSAVDVLAATQAHWHIEKVNFSHLLHYFGASPKLPNSSPSLESLG